MRSLVVQPQVSPAPRVCARAGCRLGCRVGSRLGSWAAVALAAGLSAAVTACAAEPEIPTEELVVAFVATQTDDAPFAVQAEFRLADRGPCVDLASTDRVAAAADAEPVALSPDGACDEGGPALVGALAQDIAAGAVVVSLERARTIAPIDTAVVLPPAFTLDVSAATVSRTDELSLSWPPSADIEAAQLAVDGECLLSGLNAAVAVDFALGQLVIPPAAVRVRPDLPPDSSCPMTVQLTLLRRDVANPVYAAGAVEGRRVRTAVVTSTP